MISLLLGLCLSAPLFASNGPDCVGSALEEQCRCTECFWWDRVPGATYYAVFRSIGPEYWALVGDTINWNRPPYTDEEGNDVAEVHVTQWCAAWDSRLAGFPLEGVLYEYRVQACNQAGCSPLSDPTWYKAAPYWCWENGTRVACR